MNNINLREVRAFGVALSLGLVGCGGADLGDEQALGSTEQATVVFDDDHEYNGTTWPGSGGVATIPYEIVPYTGAAIPNDDNAGGVGVTPLGQQDFLPGMRYIEDATNLKIDFKSAPTANPRIRLVGMPSWSDDSGSCNRGRFASGTTDCSFRQSQIVAIAHRKNGSANPIWVYFSDGTARQVPIDNLQPSKADNKIVTYPTNPLNGKPYRPDEVAAIDHSGAGVIAWYTNGYTSKGTPLEPGSSVAPRPYTRKMYYSPQHNVSFAMKLVGVAITPNAGKAYAFWLDPRADANHPTLLHTVGASSTDLVGDEANSMQVDTGDLDPSSILGMVYDEDSNLNTYLYGKRRAKGNRGSISALGMASAKMYQVPGFTTVVHELTHALGFGHEQMRNDSYRYVKPHEPLTGNYEIQSTSTFGEYDLSSRMHYEGVRLPENDVFGNNQLSYSWRDVRGILAETGLGDPQASATTESQIVASWTQAAKNAGAQLVYTPATGRLPVDIVGLDIEGNTGYIRTYYTRSGTPNLNMSYGTTYDLGRYTMSSPFGQAELSIVSSPHVGATMVPASSVLGIVFSDYEALTWFKTTSCASRVARTRGSYTILDSVWAYACVSLPSGYAADQIRDIARYRYAGATKFVTLYDDGKFSIGTTTDLASDSGGTFEMSFPEGQEIDAARVYGFALKGATGYFFLGCPNNDSSCGNEQFRYVEVSDFVDRLPAEFH